MMTDHHQGGCSCQSGERPDFLPEKFWDPEGKKARYDMMAQSYRALERKIGQGGHKSMAPDHHGAYKLSCKSDLFTENPVVNQRLHVAGFSNEQAQVVYDLAHEALEPLVAEIFALVHAQAQGDRLVERFGGEDRWDETARQLKLWGEQKFGQQAFAHMTSSVEGVISLYEMMGKDEPDMMSGAAPQGLNSEGAIRKLMRDPKYWRERDPSMVAKVRAGFKSLYPD